jgi:DNA-binding beta-propeller fold protein YncE
MKWIAAMAGLMVALAGCGGGSHRRHANRGRGGEPGAHHLHRADPLALVTAETRNAVVAVDVRTGQIRGRVLLPADPENVAVAAGVAVVVSSAAGTVSLLDDRRLRVQSELHGFAAPHIPAIAPDLRYAYVTDDAAGTLTPIKLHGHRALAPVALGAGAHHLSFSPNGRTLWVALGESARTIVIVDVRDPARPRIIRRFDPGFAAHDLVFSPDGRSVWVSAATGRDVTVLDSRTLHVRFRVPVGRGPQHIVLNRGDAYVTSGYASVIERVSASTGRILARERTPYGSFELDARGDHVATSSLLRGEVALFDSTLHVKKLVHVAPATRDVAIVGG